MHGSSGATTVITLSETSEESRQAIGSEADRRFDAMLLLAGGIASSPLSRAVKRSPLQLPVGPQSTVLSQWCEQTSARSFGSNLPVRLLIDKPSNGLHPEKVEGVSICMDQSEFRGAGGALVDAASELPEQSWVLAAPAAQIMLRPLSQLVSELTRDSSAEVILAANRDGTPGTLLLARVSVLRRIPAVGFVDLKEQALPLLAKYTTVRVHRFRSPIACSIRTPVEYLRAISLHHAASRQGSFALVEPGASTSPHALLRDSVVLTGAQIPPRCVLVRCLVCAGATLTAGQTYVDQTLASAHGVSRRRTPSHSFGRETNTTHKPGPDALAASNPPGTTEVSP